MLLFNVEYVKDYRGLEDIRKQHGAGKAYRRKQLMVRQNRVASVRFGGVLIAPPLSAIPSRATELLVDSSLHAVPHPRASSARLGSSG